MGVITQSSARNEPAPPYDDLLIDHERPANTISGYALVPRGEISRDNISNGNNDDDTEQQLHNHNHNHDDNQPTNMAMDMTDLQPPATHVHCEACERLLERKERRNNEQHCCMMVSITFMVAFICMMLLGIAIVRRVTKA